MSNSPSPEGRNSKTKVFLAGSGRCFRIVLDVFSGFQVGSSGFSDGFFSGFPVVFVWLFYWLVTFSGDVRMLFDLLLHQQRRIGSVALSWVCMSVWVCNSLLEAACASEPLSVHRSAPAPRITKVAAGLFVYCGFAPTPPT